MQAVANKIDLSAESVFSQFFSLTDSIAVYVPATTDVNKPIDNTSFVEKVSEKLSSLFGGSTITKAQGTWIDATGHLILENTVIVKSYAEKVTADNANEVISLAQWLKDELYQEAVSVEYNNRLIFV